MAHTKGQSVREPSTYIRHVFDILLEVAYLAPASSNGEGDVWVKLAHEGNPGQWAVERLKTNGGKVSFRGVFDRRSLLLNNFLQWDVPIPSELAPGKYILRVEIIALHEGRFLYSETKTNGAQFYPDCIQIEVTGSGTRELPSGVPFPG